MPKFPPPPEKMRLRYAQLEELIAGMLEVHDDRRATLGGRIRLFRLRGFPPNVATEAKTRFAYDLEAILRTALAFSMLNAFIPQDLVPTLIERDWTNLKAAFQASYGLIERVGHAAAAIDSDRSILTLQPQNLITFTFEKTAAIEPGSTVATRVMTAGSLSERLFDREHDEDFNPLTMIDLHHIAAWIRSGTIASNWASPNEFVEFANG